MTNAPSDGFFIADSLEAKMRKCYEDNCYYVEGYMEMPDDSSFALVCSEIGDALAATNRKPHDGLLLVEEYFSHVNPEYVAEELGSLVISTINSIGTSGLTGKMAADIFRAYHSVSPRPEAMEEIVQASNSSLETIRETYHNVKFVKMLIKHYTNPVGDVDSIGKLSAAVNTTLRTLHGTYFKIEDVRQIIDSYSGNAMSYRSCDTYVADLSRAVCRTIEYAKQNKVQLKPLIKRIMSIRAKDTVFSEDKNDCIDYANMLCDMLIGTGA